MALINNQGDIGKTLDQLGQEKSVQNLVTAMVTAGALDKLGKSDWLTFDGHKLSEIGLQPGQVQDFSANLFKNAVNATSSAAVSAMVSGKPFDENSLADALGSALVTTSTAFGAKGIGDAKDSGDLNTFTHKLAHAVLGCAGGAATQGSMDGCSPGAVGAVVGELAAEYYNPSGNPAKAAETVNFAKLMSALAGVIATGDGSNAQAVNTAAAMGANAAENNFLTHAQAKDMKADLAACKATPSTCDENAIVEKYRKFSNANIQTVQDCVLRGDSACVANATKDAATVAEVTVPGSGGVTALFEARAKLAQGGHVVTLENGMVDDKLAAQQMAVVRNTACVGLSAAMCDVKILGLQAKAQKISVAMFGGTMLGAPAAMLLIESAPALASAAKMTIVACNANLVLCASKAGMAAADILGADALGGASLVPVVTVGAGAGAKVLTEVEQLIADVKAAEKVVAQNGANATGMKGLAYLNNSTAPETRSSLQKAVNMVRTELPTGGNVGLAQVNVPAYASEPIVLKAYSGYDEAINSFLPKPGGDASSWILQPSAATSKYVGGPAAYLRDVDSEFKILETIAQKLGNNPNATGQIKLISEKLVCPSCSSVVMQFREKFPKIQLNVFTKE